MPLDPATLQEEAVDHLVFGDDGDDEDYDPQDELPDVPLMHNNIISLNELHDLHLDAAILVSSRSSDEDISVHSTDSLDSDVSDDSVSSDDINSVADKVSISCRNAFRLILSRLILPPGVV